MENMNMNENNFKTEVIFSTMEMTTRQKIICGDLSGTTKINAVMEENRNKIVINGLAAFWIVRVTKTNGTTYDSLVLSSKNDGLYSTSSPTAIVNMKELWAELGEDLISESTQLTVVALNSKQYPGKKYYKILLTA